MSDEQLEQGAGAAPAAPQTVGATLRAAREARGETLAEAAEALKLTSRQVDAMETGLFERLPGPAFVRGFVRNYARHLGLDSAALMASLEREITPPVVELAPMSNAEGTMPAGGVGRPAHRPLIAIVAVLVLAMLAGWYFDWFRTPEPPPAPDARDEAPASTEQRFVPPAPEILRDEPPAAPLPSDPSAVPQPGLPAPGGAPAASAVTPPAGEPPAAPAPAAVPAVPAAPAVVPSPLVAPPAVPAPAAPAPAAQPAPAERFEQLVFRLQGESWLEVRDGDGALIFSGVAPAASSRTVQGKPPFAVIIGNAPEVRLEYRGQPIDLAQHTRVGVARLTVK